jgi:hypothetical protein
MSLTSAVLTAWLAHRSASTASGLDTFKTWADGIATIVTALALITGGIWAYFKFARGRTFRPRLEIEMSGQWLKANRKHWLQARIKVKNIGASKVMLRQNGTGLKVRVLADAQSPPPDYAKWKRAGWCIILEDHQWIEPGETVSDDLLLNLGTRRPVPVHLDARVNAGRRSKITVSARQVLPASTVIS